MNQLPWISGLYAALSTLLVLVLAALVVRARRASRVGLGSGGDAALERLVRVHGNATENLPLALLVLLALELTGSPAWQLHALGVAVIVGRVMHAVGLARRSGRSPGRFYGQALCWVAMLIAALLLLARAATALLAG